MTIEFTDEHAAASLELTDLNVERLWEIREMAVEHGGPAAYLVPVAELLTDDSCLKNETCVVAWLPRTQDAADLANPEVYSSIETQLDGGRVACLMLAKGAVALADEAVWSSGAGQENQLLVFWLFNNSTVSVCQYRLSEDLVDALDIDGKCAESHVHLTKEETIAWQKVARQAKHVGLFDVFDLTEEEVLET
ncbi:hypothetical protein DID96_37030 [Burkholderia sp. Bp8963]|uniref:hypothetical protein n=1 Tax=Burkholderia sp. Bp8963 TaxID=2184547 RepID=UPI000F5B4CDF|nr:hypothetical protein [Burkholderia sp. Bp8963]RQS56875.1 hypothetical protein DID96_37030 [Burkholderia sp. Bp8963]